MTPEAAERLVLDRVRERLTYAARVIAERAHGLSEPELRALLQVEFEGAVAEALADATSELLKDSR
jgi:hypothetical protein